MVPKPLNLLRQLTDNFNFRVDPEKSEQENAEEVTRSAALVCAAVAAEPIPFADIAVILPLQVKLVLHVGRIYGFDISTARARKIVLEVGGAVAYGWVARQAVRGLAKVALPGLGGLLTAPLAYGSTFALGRIAERYFRAQRGDLPPLTPEERRMMEKTLVAEGRVIGGSVKKEDLESLRDGLRARARERRGDGPPDDRPGEQDERRTGDGSSE
ncbi:MAG TPA: DUF697 domain-containing protein [Deinococcales bacterium]|nr:DUF697 domain-containing protein [Deinococcales bacterium]